MPNPTAAPRPTRKRLSRELDRALDKALRGGNLGQVEQVLGQLDTAETERPSKPEPRVVLAFEQPQAASQDPMKLLAGLQEQLACVAEQWAEDPRAAEDTLAQAATDLRSLRDQAKALPDPEPIQLPPFRLPYALVVDPPGNLEQAPDFAKALGLDLASARMHARAQHPKIVLRSGDPEDIRARATRYTAHFSRPARELNAQALLALGRPRTALRIGVTWELAGGDLWAREPGELPPGAGQVQAPLKITLVVPGEVIVATYRRRGDGGVSASGERRIQVADLHGPACFVRVVAGHCALPTAGESALRAHRAWIESLDCQVLASRSCPAGEPPASDGEGPLQATGWALFEEHSRGARLLYGAGERSPGA